MWYNVYGRWLLMEYNFEFMKRVGYKVLGVGFNLKNTFVFFTVDLETTEIELHKGIASKKFIEELEEFVDEEIEGFLESDKDKSDEVARKLAHNLFNQKHYMEGK